MQNSSKLLSLRQYLSQHRVGHPHGNDLQETKGGIMPDPKKQDHAKLNDFLTFEESRIHLFMKKMKVVHIEGLKTHCQIRKIIRNHKETHMASANSISST